MVGNLTGIGLDVNSREETTIRNENEKPTQKVFNMQKKSFSIEPEKMPLNEEIIFDQELLKLTSAYKWKSMRLVLTPTRLAMSNVNLGPGEDSLLKDSIPLEEIRAVNWRKALPERAGSVSHLPFDGHDGSQVFGHEEKTENWEKLHVIQIRTVPGGHNSGRDYFFRSETEETGLNLMSLIKSSNLKALEVVKKRENDKLGQLRVLQKQLKARYDNCWTERVTALIITMNFAVCIAQAQMNVADGSSEARFFDRCDIAFTSIFTFELLVNLTANWLRPFFCNGWCIFDFVVVVISLVALCTPNLPGITQLRLIRVLRRATAFPVYSCRVFTFFLVVVFLPSLSIHPSIYLSISPSLPLSLSLPPSLPPSLSPPPSLSRPDSISFRRLLSLSLSLFILVSFHEIPALGLLQGFAAVRAPILLPPDHERVDLLYHPGWRPASGSSRAS